MIASWDLGDKEGHGSRLEMWSLLPPAQVLAIGLHLQRSLGRSPEHNPHSAPPLFSVFPELCGCHEGHERNQRPTLCPLGASISLSYKTRLG